MNKLPLRVCYFGTYRSEYARNQIVLEGLRQAGIKVIECHQKLWYGDEDRLKVAEGRWFSLGFMWRVFVAYFTLLQKYRKIDDYDIMMVGYPGHYDIFLAHLLSHLKHKPLIWDVLNSLFLILTDRGIAKRKRFTAGIVQFLEMLAVRQPDMLFIDTPIFAQWFHQTYQVPVERFRIVPIAADDRFFASSVNKPSPAIPPETFQVLYYGTYIPNHGTIIIVEAARLLQNERDIYFEMVGDGPERNAAEQLAKQYQLRNIHFIQWLEKPELVQHIQDADICLGSFGNTLQSSLTYNNKILEAFASRKPVISAETPATPPDIRHGEHLYQCKRGNAQSLADGILAMKNDPKLRQRLAENGYQIFHAKYNVLHIGKTAAAYLTELASRRR